MKPKSSTPPPSPLEAHLGFLLRFVSNHVSNRFKQQLETKGAASKVVSRLEEMGLAKRQFARENARDQTLALTASGRALVPVLAAMADANDEHFFGHLGAQERQVLMSAIQALVQHHQLQDIPIA